MKDEVAKWLGDNGLTAERSPLEGSIYILRDGFQVGKVYEAEEAQCTKPGQLIEIIKQAIK